MFKIDGKRISEELLEKLGQEEKPQKFLAAILVGDNPASENFVARKKAVAEKLGIGFRIYKFPESIKNDELRKEVRKTSSHATCGGVIVQLPLPPHINTPYILNVIPEEKDVDVLGSRALGRFLNGGELLPPSVEAFKEILDRQNIIIEESFFCIFGAGNLIGKPIATWLLGKARQISVIDKGGDREPAKQANIIVSGVGEKNLFSAKQIKSGAGVIDFGVSFDDGKIVGDFDPNNTDEISFYTPTPGGTGPILIAKIFENFYKLNKTKKRK